MGNCFSGAEPSAGGKRVTAASFSASASSSSSRSPPPPPFDDFLVVKVDGSSPPPPPITDVFTLGRVLGRGAFGVTRLAKERATGQSAAVKTIARRRIAAIMPDGAERVRSEVEAMRRVAGHPHIVSLKSCHEDEKGVHLAMELCSGGELFDQVSKRGAYTEACAASLVRELARVVAHCHDRGVVHRDLKPENLLLASPQPDAALKAIDFGLAALVEPAGGSSSARGGPPLTELCGSPLYIAPEVLRRSYGREADLWSVGVIAHVLLTGRAPFEGPTEKELFDRILAQKLDFRSEPWPQLSPGARDFVSRLLERDPRRRLTARQALEHSWLSDGEGGGSAAAAAAAKKKMACAKQLDVLKTMCNFAAAGKVRRRAAAVVAERAPPELVEALLPAFVKVDAADAGDGTVALGALPRLLGCVDAGMAALKSREGLDAAAAIAAVAAAGDVAAEAAIAAAACACAKAASSPPPSPSPSPPPSATARAILEVFHEVMGHDGTECGCRVDYVALLKSAAEEARALREETLAAALARLDRQRAGELPRSKVEAATRRHCRAIPQHVIDRAVAAAAEAAEEASCAPGKMARKRKEDVGESVAVATAAAETKKKPETAEKGKKVKGSAGEEEQMVDYELFCAALAKVCPSCPNAAKAA